MKKLSLIYAFCIMWLGGHAQTNDINNLKDVINACIYSRFNHIGNYVKRVPLFTPLSDKRSLKICEYPTEKYYGKDIKASEHPNRTYYAYYDVCGNLKQIIDGDDDYQFEYDKEGILKNCTCYDKNTGKLIRDTYRQINLGKLDSKDHEPYSVTTKKLGRFYLTSISGFFHKNKKGYYVSFIALPYDNSKRGQIMYLLEAEFHRDSGWMKKYVGSYWKNLKESGIQYLLIKKDWAEIPLAKSHVIAFNEVGIIHMSLSEVLSEGVRDNTLYEYHWSK